MAAHHADHQPLQLSAARTNEQHFPESTSEITLLETDKSFQCSHLSHRNVPQPSIETKNEQKAQVKRQQKPSFSSLLICCVAVILILLAAGAAAFAVVVLDFYSFAQHGNPLQFTDIRFVQPLRIASSPVREHLEVLLESLQVNVKGSNPMLLPLEIEISDLSLFFRPSPKAYSVAHTEVKRRESTSGETTNPPERKVHERTPHEQTARNRTASFPWANHHPGFEATVAFVPSTVPGSAEEPTIFPPELYRRRRRLAGESFISRHHGLFESATETQKPTGPPKKRRLSSEFHNWSDEDALGHLFMQEGDGLPHELWTAHSYVPGRQLHPSRVNGVAIDRGAREILVTETPQTGWKVQGWEPGDELLENPLLVQDILDALSPGRSVADVPSRLERGSDRHGKPGSHIRTEELQSGDVSGNFGNSDSAPPAASRGPFPSYLQFANATACPPRTESEDVVGASHGLCPEWHGIGHVQQKSDMVSGDRPTTVVYTIRPRSSIQLPLEVSKQEIWHPTTDNMTIALEIMVACLSEGFAQFQLRTSKPKLTMASGLVSVEIDAVHSEPIFMPCEYTQEVQLAARGRSEVKGEIVQNV